MSGRTPLLPQSGERVFDNEERRLRVSGFVDPFVGFGSITRPDESACGCRAPCGSSVRRRRRAETGLRVVEIARHVDGLRAWRET
jgi:hypothetical protein